MMKINFEERKPIWIALSNFYLDTELEDYEIKHIAKKIKESPYSLAEVEQINKREVFPVLYMNGLSVAGIWSGFEEEWLIAEITKELQKRKWFSKLRLTLKHRLFKWMYKDYWEKLEKVFQEL